LDIAHDRPKPAVVNAALGSGFGMPRTVAASATLAKA